MKRDTRDAAGAGIYIRLAGAGRRRPGLLSAENWAYLEIFDRAADGFFICPTVYGGGEGDENMPLSDGRREASSALQHGKGI
ncbi:MAG: hypothetical protein ACLUEK_10420 [Oscillospiraceae bacterium]